jgi:lysophospholipase L1-like esterase
MIKKTTFNILGDSISTFAGYNPKGNAIFYPREGYDVVNKEQTWWSIFCEQTKFHLLLNNSYSGSRISQTGIEQPLSSAFIAEERLQDFPKSDFTIIFGGTNDFGQPEQQASLLIFKQSYITLINKLAIRKYLGTLFFCTPLQRLDFGLHERNTQGWTQIQLAQTIRDAVLEKQKTIPYIKLVDLARFSIKKGDRILQDGLHPTIVGMQIVATLMERGIQRQDGDVM